MMEIGLAEAISYVRRELQIAVDTAENEDMRFPIGDITLSFQVGITNSVGGSGGFDVRVLRLDAEGVISREMVHTVTVALKPPVGPHGDYRAKSARDELPG